MISSYIYTANNKAGESLPSNMAGAMMPMMLCRIHTLSSSNGTTALNQKRSQMACFSLSLETQRLTLREKENSKQALMNLANYLLLMTPKAKRTNLIFVKYTKLSKAFIGLKRCLLTFILTSRENTLKRLRCGKLAMRQGFHFQPYLTP